MSEREWYETVFTTRFRPGNVPRTGDALLGGRFRLLVEVEPDDWQPYDQDACLRGEQ